MNKTLKFALIFTASAVTAGVLYALWKKRKNNRVPDIEDYQGPAVTQKVKAAESNTGIDKNKTLAIGLYNSPEVEELQRLLGFTGKNVDGDFGPKTEAALEKLTGSKTASISQVIAKINQINAGTKAAAVKAQVNAAYPEGKKVIAAVDFRGFYYIYRSGYWMNTDKDGNPLGSREFKKGQDLGSIKTVASYTTTPPAIIVGLRPDLYGKDAQGNSLMFIQVNGSWLTIAK
jgi:hypothetical protein